MSSIFEVACVACGRDDDGGRGWGGYRTDAEPDEEPAVVFLCPECAERELGEDEAG